MLITDDGTKETFCLQLLTTSGGREAEGDFGDYLEAHQCLICFLTEILFGTILTVVRLVLCL